MKKTIFSPLARRAALAYSTVKAAWIALSQQTYYSRWHHVARAGAPPWDDRNRVIASLILPGSSVLDIGSGAQTLRTHLHPQCTYQPCDIVKSSEDVIVCDFNAGNYPQTARLYDYAVCSGVLEYMRDPDDFIGHASQLARRVLISYNPLRRGESKLARLRNNWINHLTQEELEQMFARNGLRWELAASIEQQCVYLLVPAANSPSDGQE